jgi:hypothetical protein
LSRSHRNPSLCLTALLSHWNWLLSLIGWPQTISLFYASMSTVPFLFSMLQRFKVCSYVYVQKIYILTPVRT